ncbi:hypothetical protein [Streptomyces sp. NPDC003395]
MPLRAKSLPGDLRTVFEELKDLRRAIAELRASRGLADASIPSSMTATGQNGQSVGLNVVSPTGITLPDGSVIYPPSVTMRSANGDATAGILASYRKPTAGGTVPATVLLTPVAGPTGAGLSMQAGEESGETPFAQLAAGAATLKVTPTSLTVTLSSGVALTFSAAGLTAAGTTAAPIFVEDPNTTTCTATSFADAASGVFSASVTVPPSGKVLVEVRCTQRASGTLNAFTSWRGVGSISGTKYTENLTAALAVNGGNNFSLSLRHLLPGLTPGETLTVSTKHRLNGAGTQTIDYRSILLEPSTA